MTAIRHGSRTASKHAYRKLTTVFDLGFAKQLTHVVELNLSFDNLTNRDYYETQNYFESRVAPAAPIVARIHATPAYPLTAAARITLRFRAR